MGYKVSLTDRALRDLDKILEWLADENTGEAGQRWFSRLQQAISSLSEMPGRCASAPETEQFPFHVQQLVYGQRPHQYRVLFLVDGDEVVILHVRHGRRTRFYRQP